MNYRPRNKKNSYIHVLNFLVKDKSLVAQLALLSVSNEDIQSLNPSLSHPTIEL